MPMCYCRSICPWFKGETHFKNEYRVEREREREMCCCTWFKGETHFKMDIG